MIGVVSALASLTVNSVLRAVLPMGPSSCSRAPCGRVLSVTEQVLEAVERLRAHLPHVTAEFLKGYLRVSNTARASRSETPTLPCSGGSSS